MGFHPMWIDFAILVLLFATTFFEQRWYETIQRAIASGTRPMLRSNVYLFEIAMLWAFAGAVVALWASMARPWSALLLGPAVPWRLAIAAAFVAVWVGLGLRDRARIIAKPQLRERVRSLMDNLGTMMPRSPRERFLWVVLSITAGICEELIFRGFILALSSHYVGVAGGAAISSILFGIGHAYQGRQGIIRTSAFGLFVAIVALVSGSLIPVMIIHAAQDLIAGDCGHHAFREQPASAPL